VAANLLLAEQGRAPVPLLDHPSPEWLAGALARGMTSFRHAALRRRQARRAVGK
jgi:hypothetical protein